MDFGEAICLLKQGKRVAREGWNGKGMFLFLVNGSSPVDTGGVETIDGVPAALFDLGDNGTICRLPSIGMRTATGAHLTGWLASQTDMLAEDWAEVE